MKVISYSLWGKDESFYDGALENVRLAKIYYPGWTCVFFVEQDAPAEWVGPLSVHGACVHRRSISKGPWEGLLWRFEPIFDSLVSVTLSRDCDSRLNPR